METSKAQIDKVELESFNFSDPNPIEKEWILVCSRGNYMEMAKILSKNSYLAQKRDPFNGVIFL
jgi:rhodanese-related sulfurtransferase